MRILVVDDEFIALNKMSAMLSPLGKCDAATSGEQAFQMYEQAMIGGDPYKLITIDIQMPGMSGLELLEKINSEEEKWEYPKAKKMMVSAQSDIQNVTTAKHANCDAFIVKPVKKKVLSEKLASMNMPLEQPQGNGTAYPINAE